LSVLLLMQTMVLYTSAPSVYVFIVTVFSALSIGYMLSVPFNK